MINNKSDFIAGLVLAVLGVLLFISTFSIKVVAGMSVGITSEFVPRIVTCVLFAFGVCMAITNLPKKEKKDETTETNSVAKKGFNMRVLYTLVALALYFVLIGVIGFVVSTIVYLISQCCILAPKEKRKYMRFTIIAVITAVVVYYVFSSGFNLLLPLGVFG